MTRIDPIESVFALLDRWRHLPAYQLERRADIFFAVYLRDVVQAFVGEPLLDTMIPELPIKLDVIWPERRSNLSVKVDYALFAAGGERVYFVELKTDDGSRSPKQDEDLRRAGEVGFRSIVAGIRDIMLNSGFDRKYFHLIAALSDLGFLELPHGIEDQLYPVLQPSRSAHQRRIEVTARNPAVEVIFLQPTRTKDERCLDFATFANHVSTFDDPLSRTFAVHLRRWIERAAALPPVRR